MAYRVREFCILATLFFATGCTITVKNPANRFESPETTGKLFRVQLETGIGGSNNVVLTPDYTYTAPNTANPSFEAGSQFFVGGGMGLADDIDVDLRSTGDLRFKFQLMGEPRLNAKEDDFSLAVTASIGYSNQSGSGTSTLPGGLTAKYNLSDYTLDGALIMGYRATQWCLIYFGPFITHKHFSGTWEESSPSVVKTDLSGNSDQTGGDVGVEFGSKLFQIRAEGSYASVKSGSVNNGRFYFGTEVAFNFGKH